MTRMTTQHLVEAPARTTTSGLHTRIRRRELQTPLRIGPYKGKDRQQQKKEEQKTLRRKEKRQRHSEEEDRH